MITVYIENTAFLVSSKLSVLEACKFLGLVIPRFCYHEILSVAGNCRMCLVEIENAPKPMASCALPVLNNMKIFLDTPLVKKARENIIESLLLNHPLDCPICDQGGECDLQDQAKTFGNNSTRFFFKKNGVEDKNLGPLIKTIMTRCINCTRCVRFNSEISGVEVLGTLNRGGSSEIGNYTVKAFTSEISGNVIDLCPVGALTSKPYAFKARPWELRVLENIDVTDSLGSNIYVHLKESSIERIMPKINQDLNGSLISDKARFFYDSLTKQRLLNLNKKKDTSFLQSFNWFDLINQVKELILLKKKISFVINEELDFKSLYLLKFLENKYKNISVYTFKKTTKRDNFHVNWSFDFVKSLQCSSKVCFIFSSNIRIENAILNSKLRLKFGAENIKFFSSMVYYNSNFPISFINLHVNTFIKLLESKSKSLSKLLIKDSSPIFFLGSSLSKRGLNLNFIQSHLKNISPTAVILNLKAFSNSSSNAYLNINSLSKNSILNSDFLFVINLNESFSFYKYILSGKKNVFMFNTHGFSSFKKCDTLIPILDTFEESNIYINLEDRPQTSLKIISNPGNARSLKSFLELLLQSNLVLTNAHNFFFEILKTPKVFSSLEFSFSLWLKKNSTFNFISTYPVKLAFEDFYRSNKHTKISSILMESSYEVRKSFRNFF